MTSNVSSQAYMSLHDDTPESIKPYNRLHVDDTYDNDESPQRKDIHWKAPALILLCLLLATILAVAHHEFYKYWNDRSVADATQQRWITRGGTAFSFLFKTACLVSVSTVYVQVFWRTVRRQSHSVADVNSMFAILRNPFNFFEVPLWVRRPMLAAIAVIAWILPLSAVITPGTITINPITSNYTDAMNVPQLDFETPIYAVISVDNDFVGAAPQIIRSALVSSIGGAILSISPPTVNSTYTTQFWGPALSCRPADESDQQKLYAALNNATTPPVGYQYAAWVPADSFPATNSAYIPDFSTYPDTWPTLDSSFGNKSLLWVYARGSLSGLGNLTLCSLYNVSYNVEFTFNAGSQALDARIDSYENEVGRVQLDDVLALHGASGLGYASESYLSIFAAFNEVLIGTVEYNQYFSNYASRTIVQSTSLNETLFDQSVNLSRVPIAIEELFQNVTLSLLGLGGVFLKNSTSSTPTNVLVTTYRNQYSYYPTDLYISYGLALLVTLMIVIYGLVASLDNGRSYTNDFSTLLCSTRDTRLLQAIDGKAQTGADPLANKVKKIHLQYHLRGDGEEAAGFRCRS